ncbi:MAG: glutamine--fructose-6-phosphate transaminase (isomerizing) [Gemmatimonadaceae bacterium 4484_173]|nr:MAG: glutamine--fructose-6-phosphate transaminase (isomerizing) [Gemmatimonadaceae bacterium 4484_173]RKZ04716.1 MAG: glutamine--fructose-6-phosphate transaminase (isomerizing) [Candidatus Fermentibacteria bacterium]
MCGIVGYVGKGKALDVLLSGLKRLEYRGYDSAGYALQMNNELVVRKCTGRVADLEEMDPGEAAGASTGIAHTRWATHGEPTTVNAHPHSDFSGRISLVHNGIIENYKSLRKKLIERGLSFESETDTEVLAKLIGSEVDTGKDLFNAVKDALVQVRGTYGIAVISADQPSTVVAARYGSPLVVGIGEGENIIASDVAAIVAHTRSVIYLEEGEIVEITSGGISSNSSDPRMTRDRIQHVDWDLAEIEKDGYPHYMLKEINSQPESLRNAFRGRIDLVNGTARLGGIEMSESDMRGVKRIVITACGTSWHSGLIGKYIIEKLARIPVDVEYASEFRYRDPVLEDGTVMFVISQSGETADTLAALRLAKERGIRTLGIVNVVGSTIARETDSGVYIHAGPEIGVASTKAFTGQTMILSLIALAFGRAKGNLTREDGIELCRGIMEIPEKVETILKGCDSIMEIARQFTYTSNFLYLGRGVNYPVALEGALKLKEISYIHAEGYPAAEMKHGPIALIDDMMPVAVIAVKDAAYEKVMSNIHEVKARKGRVLAIATEGDAEIRTVADWVLEIPPLTDILVPLLSVIPLQLLSYYVAVSRGCDVDKPRNLAKSVTVE